MNALGRALLVVALLAVVLVRAFGWSQAYGHLLRRLTLMRAVCSSSWFRSPRPRSIPVRRL